jgi:hypothetical protein
MTHSPTVIGQTNFRNESRFFGIKQHDRRQHMYLVGKTGTGKSTLLKNLILQDIRAGHGVGMIDPHGDLVTDLLAFVPAERISQVVYVNPADQEFPVGFNILEAVDPLLRPLVASHVVSVLKHIWSESWGPRLEYILSNAVHTLLEAPESTLLGIPRLLADQAYRKSVVSHLGDPMLKHFWTNEYDRYSASFQKEAIAPIQNKVGQFITSTLVRYMVGQTHSKAEFSRIVDTGQILLVNLSKGKIGEAASALLGSLMVSKLFLAALQRSDQREEERRDFFLYLDECHNLASPVLASILAEARKYRLNVTLGHQYLEQLPADIQHAIFGNVGTLISFRVGSKDARALEEEFGPEFSAFDLENLGPYHVAVKLAVDGITTRPFSAFTLPAAVPEPDHRAARIIEHSRHTYGMKRELVEQQLNTWLSLSASPQKIINRS